MIYSIGTLNYGSNSEAEVRYAARFTCKQSTFAIYMHGKIDTTTVS